MKAGVLACALVAITAVPASAQTSRVALDAVVSADTYLGSTVRRYPGAWFDVFGAVRIADGLDVVARPVLSRRTFNGSWQEQIYQLGVRYERPLDFSSGNPRALGLRIDAGILPSPIGLGMLENRQDLNPVISQHSAYYLPLPAVDPEIPRTFLIAGTYPLGAQLTVAARSWDARVALIDASPVRGRPFLGSNKPPRMPNWVAGFGVTPRAGLRLGGAVAHGPYVRESEVQDTRLGDRTASILQMEGEWSFGYTRIAGELVRGTMETARARDAATRGGWVEITQTLHPRVFAAGRADVQAISYARSDGVSASAKYQRYEAVAGVRLTRDLTVRAGYLTRKGYVVFHWDDQFVASVTWQRKIF